MKSGAIITDKEKRNPETETCSDKTFFMANTRQISPGVNLGLRSKKRF